MKKDKDISRYTARQIETMRRKDRDRTDLTKVDAMTDADVDALAAEDDEGSFDWSRATVGFPGPKQQLDRAARQGRDRLVPRPGPRLPDPHERRTPELRRGPARTVGPTQGGLIENATRRRCPHRNGFTRPRFATLSALSWMNSRRGSTSSPISRPKRSSASSASRTLTWRSVRTSGSSVVSQSCSAFISPRPL